MIIMFLLIVHAVVVGEQHHKPPTSDLQFPLSADLVNFTRGKDITTIIIPPSLVRERLREKGIL